jgi:hypothetical protein
MRWQMREATWSTNREDRRPVPRTTDDDLEALQGLWDVRFFTYPTGRRRVAVQIRRGLHAALFPLLVRVSEFNAAVARRLTALSVFEDDVERRLSAVERRLQHLDDSADPVRGGLRPGRVGESLLRGLPRNAVVAADPHEVAKVRTIRADRQDAIDPVAAGLDDLDSLADDTVDAIVLSRELAEATEASARSAFTAARRKLKAGGTLTIWAPGPDGRAGGDGLEPDVLRRLLLEIGFTTVVLVDDVPVDGALEYEIMASNGS